MEVRGSIAWRENLEEIIYMLDFTTEYQVHETTKARRIEREVTGMKRRIGKGKSEMLVPNANKCF